MSRKGSAFRGFIGDFGLGGGDDAGDIPRTYISLAIVAQSEDPSTGYMYLSEHEEIMVEVVLQPDGGRRSAYLGLVRRDGNALGFVPVRPGDTVALEWPDGEEGHPIVVSRVRSSNEGDKTLPTVAGLSMQAPGEVPRPRIVTAYRGGAGEPIAVQGDQDVLVHARGQVELKAQALHLDGTAHLGRGLTTPPVGPLPSASGVESGSAGEGYTPPPYTTPSGNPSVLDAIVRVQDPVISTFELDPVFWAWMAWIVEVVKVVAGLLGVPVPPPLVALDPTTLGPRTLTSKPDGASKHTASGA